MEIALNSLFGVYEWKKLSRACHAEKLSIDLSSVEFAYPSGIVTFNVGDFTGASQLGIEVMTPGEFLRTIE